MNVVCPSCETTFSFPDDIYQVGKKVRCSICKHVFPLPEKTEGSNDCAPEAISKKKKLLSFLKLPSIKISGASRSKKLIVLGTAILSLCLIGFVSYMGYKMIFSSDTATEEQLTPEQQTLLNAQYERIKKIRLSDVRQFYVSNEKLKRDILVIQGVAYNDFDTPRSFIEVEALLLGEGNKVLASKKQIAGPTLSSLQLQVFGEKDFSDILTKNNKLTVLMANKDLPPGQSVPFMVLFTDVPENVSAFEVRPINAFALDDFDPESSSTPAKK